MLDYRRRGSTRQSMLPWTKSNKNIWHDIFCSRRALNEHNQTVRRVFISSYLSFSLVSSHSLDNFHQAELEKREREEKMKRCAEQVCSLSVLLMTPLSLFLSLFFRQPSHQNMFQVVQHLHPQLRELQM